MSLFDTTVVHAHVCPQREKNHHFLQVFLEVLNETSWKTTSFWLKGYEVLSGEA